MPKLNDLHRLGQSIWLDYIRRAFLTSGELEHLIEQGLRGVTSNPSIFEKAIAGSADYDAQLRGFVKQSLDAKTIYETLAIEDIAMAADQLRPVYEASDGSDGFVSLEVSPTLAHDTKGTVAEAHRLFKQLGRPNVMIKVPATREGLQAITELIARGIPVNVTLIFSLETYRQVANAYLRGLERLAENGPGREGGLPLDRLASVASVFVSRIDTAVDRELERKGNVTLQGKLALANARVIYAAFQEIFRGPRWQALQSLGAQVQRPLWASTGIKNPLYPDTLYVDQLIGAHTVNTVPPATLTAFLDHGTAAETLPGDVEEARRQLQELASIGIDLDAIMQQLQQEGLKAFSDSFAALLSSVETKLDVLRAQRSRFVARLANFAGAVEKAQERLREEEIVGRLWKHDFTIWKDSPQEIADRLGWLHSPEVMTGALPVLEDFVAAVRQDGFRRVLLLGMGGSSLAPEVFRRIFGVHPGYPDLEVLDSTDPETVADYSRRFPPEDSLFVVSTKSGGTVETLSLMKHFYNLTARSLGAEKAGQRFVAITDPGSGLEKLARELQFRRIFLNDPAIGGRYSALSYFGLVPAALIGANLAAILDRAATMACNCEGCNCPVQGDNTGARLGAILGTLALQGRDKLTLVPSPTLAPFGAWLEQLVAESTGKEGKGIVPIDGEPLLPPEFYRDDRLFVQIRLENDNDEVQSHRLHELAAAGHPVVTLTLRDLYDLGGEFFRWEVATAVAGYFLRINPFDQPNVESAKALGRDMVKRYMESGRLPESRPVLENEQVAVYGDGEGASPEAFLAAFLDRALSRPQDAALQPYVALQAYVKPDERVWDALQQLRAAIQKRYRVATTVGYGPRFLHSTGQLHKGDAGHGVFLQITTASQNDVPIPDRPGEDTSSMSFGVLKLAQALGDRQALKDGGRAVLRLHVSGRLPQVLNSLARSLS